jgi:uncharacterized protein YndB with AHSA1/START domain
VRLSPGFVRSLYSSSVPYEQTLEAFRRGDNAEAARLARVDLDDAVSSGDAPGHVDALCMLARVALRAGDLAEVKAMAADAMAVARGAGERKLERMPLHLLAVATRMAALEHRNLAYVEARAGNDGGAAELIAESRRRLAGVDAPGVDAPGVVPHLTFDEATVAALRGDYDAAASKLAEAEGLFAAAGVVPDPDHVVEIARLRELLQKHRRASRIVSSSRDIAAPATRIFELIADPAEQPHWDGNDNLRHAASGQRVRAVGDVFTMTLRRGGVRENTIVEFDEGRLIAWRPNVPGHKQPGHLWRWELEPIDAEHTRVTHTYDWTELTDRSRFPRARATTPERLADSLERLAQIAEHDDNG